MKKFFTLIALVSAITPALHGMDTNLPADVQKKYDNLTVLIQNADIEAFKPAFDALTLPAENIAALHQTVAETKATVINELESMGDKTKNWSKIAKGGLATLGGSVAGICSAALPMCLLNNLTIKNEKFKKTFGPLANQIIKPVIYICDTDYISNLSDECQLAFGLSTMAMIHSLYLGAAYKGLTYGIKTFKAGWNHKEHLQNMLAELDVIDAHITHAKA